jgi:uncharacterized membrane protein
VKPGRLVLPLVALVLAALMLTNPVTQTSPAGSIASGLTRARVLNVVEEGTIDLGAGEQTYQVFQVELLEGDYAGSRFVVDYGRRQVVRGASRLQPGMQVLVSAAPDPDGRVQVYFADFVRSGALLGVGLLFVGAILLVSRWKGLRALIGMLLSLAVIAGYILPSILAGGDPVLVTVGGSFVLMALTFYLIHGWTLKAHTAALATLIALGLTAVLASASVGAARLTGLGSEEAMFLTQFAGGVVNTRGLLLASILIGALGVLDDLTVNQISAVFELRHANPGLSLGSLFRRAMVIGQDHIAATVNTLLLAYVGASLPLLLLFSLFQEPFLAALNRAVIAEEVVRTLVGSIGLIAAVPIATGLAALVQRERERFPRWLGAEMLDADRG